MTTPLYFLTSDAVNAALARHRAYWLHSALVVLGLRDPLPVRGVLIVDWDHIPDELRQRILALRLGGPLVVVIHTYNDDLLQPMLQGRLIHVCRTLDQVFDDLQNIPLAA